MARLSDGASRGRQEQAFELHVMPIDPQSTQQALCDPQSELDVPGWQLPSVSQHPSHVPLKHELPELPTLHTPVPASVPPSPSSVEPSPDEPEASVCEPLELVVPEELAPLEVAVALPSGVPVIDESGPRPPDELPVVVPPALPVVPVPAPVVLLSSVPPVVDDVASSSPEVPPSSPSAAPGGRSPSPPEAHPAATAASKTEARTTRSTLDISLCVLHPYGLAVKWPYHYRSTWMHTSCVS